MRTTTKHALKAGAITSVEVVVENTSRAFHKTLGRMGRSIAHTYWNNRAYNLDNEIENCKYCKASRVQLGSYWKTTKRPLGGGEPREIGIWDEYCGKHNDEVHDIMLGYNRTRPN